MQANMNDFQRPIALLLSGGLDSALLLGRFLAEGRVVLPIYVRSGLHWERDELWAVKAFLIAVACDRLEQLVILDLPAKDMYEDHWSVRGRNVPDADSPDEAVYLPGRNALLTVKSALWCQLHGVEELALAVLRSNPFADATDEFFEHIEAIVALSGARPVRILRPFDEVTKAEALRSYAGDLPLELTLSCISPKTGLHCGRCNKCAERQAAFREAEIVDPAKYAE